MKANYDNKPTTFEKVGNGSTLYRYDVKEITNDNLTQWECEEVVFWGNTANDLVSALIRDKWSESREQKLVNEYNSAVLGVLTDDDAKKAKANYKAFLSERKALKEMAEKDFKEA